MFVECSFCVDEKRKRVEIVVSGQWSVVIGQWSGGQNISNSWATKRGGGYGATGPPGGLHTQHSTSFTSQTQTGQTSLDESTLTCELTFFFYFASGDTPPTKRLQSHKRALVLSPKTKWAYGYMQPFLVNPFQGPNPFVILPPQGRSQPKRTF